MQRPVVVGSIPGKPIDEANPEKGFVEYEDFINILDDENTYVYKPVAAWIERIVKEK